MVRTLKPAPIRNQRKNYTRNNLLQMAAVGFIVVVLIVWQREFLANIYFKNQITAAGLVINSGILILFGLGLVRMINLFRRYRSEERALNRFVRNLQRSAEPIDMVDKESMIADRYRMMRELYSRRAPINQNALAAALLASEASYASFPKFVNNILILTGVFGTIVSLSIALVGASDLLSASGNMEGLNTVIHGMSAALSTTMTAILCYLFFGYFYLKLTDTLTHIISRIEQVSATSLLPRFHIQPETVMQDFTDMVRATQSLVKGMQDTQASLHQTTEVLRELVGGTHERIARTDQRMDQIQGLLRVGFRLPDGEDK